MAFLKRTAGLGYVEQWRGALVPAAASLCMGGVVYALKQFLPDSLSISLRLIALVPAGALLYLLFLYMFDRKLITDVREFAVAATVRRGGSVAAT